MAWNKPDEKKVEVERKGGQRNVHLKGLIAGAIVVLGVGLAAWLLTNGEADSRPLQKKDRGLIKEIVPAVAPTNSVPKKPINPREDYDHERHYRDAHGILRSKKTNARIFDPYAHYRPAKDYRDRSREMFHHISEQSIHQLLSFRPGRGKFFGRMQYDSPAFLADFEESLKEPIIVKDTDTAYTKREKRAMIEAKIEILDRMRGGEKLGDILNAAKNEILRLNEYKKDIETQISDIMQKSELSTEDLDDYITAANKMLESKGIAPVRRDNFVDWNIRLNAERDAARAKDHSVPYKNKGE